MYLLYKPNRHSTWLARIFFYFYAFGSIAVGFGVGVMAYVNVRQAEFDALALLAGLAGIIGYAGMGYLFAWPIRLFSEWYDNKAATKIYLSKTL